MTHSDNAASARELDAFDRLSLDFPRVPKRILASMVRSYLDSADRGRSLACAVEATRHRILDACAV